MISHASHVFKYQILWHIHILSQSWSLSIPNLGIQAPIWHLHLDVFLSISHLTCPKLSYFTISLPLNLVLLQSSLSQLMAFFQVFGPNHCCHSWFFSFFLHHQYKSWPCLITSMGTTPVQSFAISCLNHCNYLVIGLHSSAIVPMVSSSSFLKFKSDHTTSLHKNSPKAPMQLKSRSSQQP